MFAKLFLLFAILPIIEIALLINVGEQIGGWNTLAFVIVTAFVGAHLVRQQGISTLLTAQRKIQLGELPGQEMAEGLLLVIAGVLLVTPGFITDAIGFLCTLPMTRPVIARQLLARFSSHVVMSQSSAQFYRQTDTNNQDKGEIIEGEFQRTDKQDKLD